MEKVKMQITKTEMRNIITETIKQVLSESFLHKDIIYGVTMSTISIDEEVNEAVRYSYPIKQVLRHLSSTYTLAWLDNQEKFDTKVHSGATRSNVLENTEECIVVYVYNSNDNIETIKEDMFRLGWIFSTDKLKLPLNFKMRGMIGLQFEKKSAEPKPKNM